MYNKEKLLKLGLFLTMFCKTDIWINNVKQDHTLKNFEKVNIYNIVIVNYPQVVDLQMGRVNI